MPSFRYQPGDRPLDGYTIEQAVGRGGFGEVYYAVSDAGRQVALKAVQNFEDVELRGISHVMNLKSQHLVSIFDVKHNAGNEPFVIMEYISGPSLRDVLDESPNGMGEAKAAFFLREMAKGISYLHDCDVVHRDLKPHNVFFEDGIVKIGDYSLSKLMTMSHRTGHTMTVGSVHYMAPEISLGRYDKTVDIYALGVMLFEMLTGKPPFLGESMGEVLMRHMSGEVDVSRLPKPFDAVVAKAMAKDPDARYQTADEMAGDIFGHEHIQNSVAGFAPTELSYIAKNVAKDVVGSGRSEQAATPVRDNRIGNARPANPQAAPFRHRSADANASRSNEQGNLPPWLAADVVPKTAYSAGRFVSQLLSSAGILPKRHDYKSEPVDPVSKMTRFFLAVLVAIAFTIFASMSGMPGDVMVFPMIVAMVASVTVAHLLRKRTSRKSFILTRIATGVVVFPAIYLAAETCGWTRYPSDLAPALIVPFLVFDWKHLTDFARPKRVMALPIMIGAAVAWVFSTNHPVLDPPVIGTMATVAGAMIAIQILFKHDVQQAARCAAEYDWSGTLTGTEHQRQPQVAAAMHRSPAMAAHQDSDPFAPTMLTPAPRGVATAEPMPRQADDGFGNVPGSPMGAPAKPPQANPPNITSGTSDITRLQALALALLGFVGINGLHRFATGRRVSGIVWLLTFGFLGFGTIIDLILIVTGSFKDAYDRPVLSWDWQIHPDNRPVASVNAITSPAKPVNAYSSVPRRVSLRGLAFSFVGMMIAAFGLLAAVLIATHAVEIIKAIPDLNRDLSNTLGSTTWDRTFESILTMFAVGGMLLGSALMVVGRAGQGGPHVARLLLGMGALAIACLIGHDFFHSINWREVATYVDQERIAPIIDHFLNSRNATILFPTTMFFATGVILLAWPSPKEQVLNAAQPAAETAASTNRVEQNV